MYMYTRVGMRLLLTALFRFGTSSIQKTLEVLTKSLRERERENERERAREIARKRERERELYSNLSALGRSKSNKGLLIQ